MGMDMMQVRGVKLSRVMTSIMRARSGGGWGGGSMMFEYPIMFVSIELNHMIVHVHILIGFLGCTALCGMILLLLLLHSPPLLLTLLLFLAMGRSPLPPAVCALSIYG